MFGHMCALDERPHDSWAFLRYVRTYLFTHARYVRVCSNVCVSIILDLFAYVCCDKWNGNENNNSCCLLHTRRRRAAETHPSIHPSIEHEHEHWACVSCPYVGTTLCMRDTYTRHRAHTMHAYKHKPCPASTIVCRIWNYVCATGKWYKSFYSLFLCMCRASVGVTATNVAIGNAIVIATVRLRLTKYLVFVCHTHTLDASILCARACICVWVCMENVKLSACVLCIYGKNFT